jgi:hypothetical protein
MLTVAKTSVVNELLLPPLLCCAIEIEFRVPALEAGIFGREGDCVVRLECCLMCRDCKGECMCVCIGNCASELNVDGDCCRNGC